MPKIEVELSDLQKLHDSLVQAHRFFLNRDGMNAAVHLGQVRYSPLTSSVEASLERLNMILAGA